MPDELMRVWVNGEPVAVRAGSVIATALLQVSAACRTSVSGEPRTAVCGMGVCFECRAVVDGVAQQRTCQMACRDGMHMETQR